MEELTTLFLTTDSLKRVLTYMCRSLNQDPITETLRVMLTSPIQFHLSRYGLGLFKGSAVFPYTYMTPEQRVWLYELVRAIRGDSNHTALNRLEDPLTFTAENDRIFLGGASLQPVKLAPTDVFDALMAAMAESRHTTPDRLKLLMNLLLQRIGCRVNIRRETLVHIQQRSDELFGAGG